MTKTFCTARMWLFGIVISLLLAAQGGLTQAMAAQPAAMLPGWLAQPESLRYQVSLGPLDLGQALLEYQPKEGHDYALTARAAGSAPFFTLDDRWVITGTHGPVPFLTSSYSVTQAENSYRADKRIDFDRTAQVARYQNRRDANDRDVVALTPELRDAFSSLYALRARGLEAVRRPHTLTALGLKQAFPMRVAAAVDDTLSINGKQTPVLRVRIEADNPAKKRTDRWTVWLLPNAALTPVQFETSLAFGTIRAVLVQ